MDSGLQQVIRRSWKKAFSYLMSKIERVIAGSNYKFLSKGENEVLLNAVVQAIPTCTMSVFLIALDLCDKLKKRMN